MRLNDLPFVMLRCLVLTILIEGVFAFLLGVRTRRGQLTVLLANVMTNPLVVSLNVLFTFCFGHVGYVASTAVLEAAAFTAEALVYRRDKPCRMNPFLLSALPNGGSYLSGLLLNSIVYK